MAKICALQLGTLSISNSRLDYYLRLAKENGANLVVLGEYVLNSFFTEFDNMPMYMLKEQSQSKIDSLKELCKFHNLTIVAPIVVFSGDKIYKSVGKFSPNSTKFVKQNFLINYPHWNEESFFDNSFDDFKPLVFSYDGVKFGVAFGFEAHFDVLWQYFMQKKIDCVLMPTACTLNSKERWDMLLKMRSFTNSIYILRINRLGVAKFGDIKSEFYGHTMLINPHGEISDTLDENEGLLICKIDKKLVKEALDVWKFRQILDKKDLI